jgi:alkaline phosphatase
VRVAAAGKAFAVFAAALSLVAGGYWLGHGGWWPGSWRTIEIQDLAIGGLTVPISLELPPLPDRPVENVVLLVGDGLGLAQTEAARWAAFGTRGRFVFERFPVVGLTATGAIDSPVTDSAAAATALATGVATRKDAVGVSAEGRRLRTILEAARDAGRPVGLVTTAEIFDATPAAFAAHVESRSREEEITDQLAVSGVDLLIGGGRERFERRARLARARERGVALPGSFHELEATRELPLWFLLEGRLEPWRGAPPLAALAAKALELLASEANRRAAGFFLLVEEEWIDSASHGKRSESLAYAVVGFDAAVAAAARFAANDGRTLVLVVGDHATGGLSIDATTTAERLRIAWASSRHTGEPVPLYAYGPAGAAERFGGSYFQGEVARRLAALLGLDLSSNWSDPR